jgi:hypothetical protein
MADPEEKKKSSWGCCFLKVVGVVVVLALIAGAVFGYFAVQSGKWLESAQESAPAAYPPLAVSAGEQEDVQRLLQRINTAKTDKTVIDETITPMVFNGVVDKIIQGEKDKGKDPDMDAFRLGVDGDHFTVTATKKVKDKMGATKYANIQATFDCEIEEGKINKLDVQKVVAGGNEAPFSVKSVLAVGIEAFKKGVNDNTSPEANKFKAFKLVKREGDRLHIIIDPSKFDSPDNAPAPKTEDVPAPKKDAF